MIKKISPKFTWQFKYFLSPLFFHCLISNHHCSDCIVRSGTLSVSLVSAALCFMSCCTTMKIYMLIVSAMYYLHKIYRTCTCIIIIIIIVVDVVVVCFEWQGGFNPTTLSSTMSCLGISVMGHLSSLSWMFC